MGRPDDLACGGGNRPRGRRTGRAHVPVSGDRRPACGRGPGVLRRLPRPGRAALAGVGLGRRGGGRVPAHGAWHRAPALGRAAGGERRPGRRGAGGGARRSRAAAAPRHGVRHVPRRRRHHRRRLSAGTRTGLTGVVPPERRCQHAVGAVSVMRRCAVSMHSTRHSELPALTAPAPRAPAPAVDLSTHRTELRILGPLEVVHRGAVAPTRGQRARALLARLVLDAGRTVSVDGLVDALWGHAPPPTAVKMVHVYVSQLRKVLPGDLLRTRAPGYVLEVAPEGVDLLRFERLRGEAREALDGGDAPRGAELLCEALDLWRGPALAEFSEPFAAAEVTRLEELRLAAVEERIDADLVLGRHADVVGEL